MAAFDVKLTRQDMDRLEAVFHGKVTSPQPCEECMHRWMRKPTRRLCQRLRFSARQGHVRLCSKMMWPLSRCSCQKVKPSRCCSRLS